MKSEEIKKCTYDPEKNPFCPIFRVGDVLNYTGQSVSSLADKVWYILFLLKFSLSFYPQAAAGAFVLAVNLPVMAV